LFFSSAGTACILMIMDVDKNPFPDSLSVRPVYQFKSQRTIIERSGSRSRTDYFFSTTTTHIPDQRSCPNPGGGVALKGITPTFLVVNG
jgi:hypothetical protein